MIVTCNEPVFYDGKTHYQTEIDMDKKTADHLIKLGVVQKGKIKQNDVEEVK